MAKDTEFEKHFGTQTSPPGAQTEQAGSRLKMEQQAVERAADDIWNDVARAGAEAADTARREAAAQGEKLKEGARDELSAFAEAVKAASETLSQRRPGITADLMGQAASGLHDMADALQHRSTGDIVSAIRDFGRRNPTAFIAGSVLAGVALGRFAGSSASRQASARADAALASMGGGRQSAAATGGTSRQASAHPDDALASMGGRQSTAATGGSSRQASAHPDDALASMGGRQSGVATGGTSTRTSTDSSSMSRSSTDSDSMDGGSTSGASRSASTTSGAGNGTTSHLGG